VGNYCYVAVGSAALGASAPTEGGEGRGHIVAAAPLSTACYYYYNSQQSDKHIHWYDIGIIPSKFENFIKKVREKAAKRH